MIRKFILAAGLAASLALGFAPLIGVAQTGAPTVENAKTLPVAVVPAAADAGVKADNAVVVQDANTITIPAANYIDQIAVVIRDIGTAALPALAALILTMLPMPIRAFAGPFMQKFMDQLLQRAIDYGVNAVKGATKDGNLNIPVGNAVLAHALQYVIDHAPGWLIKAAGGEDGLRQKIFARLNLATTAGLQDFNVPPVVMTKGKAAKSVAYRLPMNGK